MRKNRIVWLVSFIVSVVGISFYGGPVSYGSFIVISAIPLVSLFYILCVIFQFKVYQKTDGRNLVCSHASRFYFTLQNESFMSFSGIRIGFFPGLAVISGLDDGTEYELAPRSGIRKETGIVCRYRGEYEIGIRKIIVSDFFRLFTISYDNREPLRVIVRPDIVSLAELASVRDALSSSGDPTAGTAEPDVLVREYVPSDDIRMINWKISAATHKLMVRDRVGDNRRGIYVIMDPRRYSTIPEEYLPVENKILETVIALTLYFSERRIPVSVCYKDNKFHESTVSGQDQFDDFYETMCGYAFNEDENIAGLFDEICLRGTLSAKSAVFVIIHEADGAGASFIRRLGALGLSVTVYVITDRVEDKGLLENVPRCNVVYIPTDADLTEVM